MFDWPTGDKHSDTVALTYRVRELYNHLSSAQSLLVGTMRLSDALLVVLVLIGVMFLIIEAAALVMGLALARSITSSVHELFMGTERVRQGDFTHRINIESKDQLGELAESFNQMTGSIENLLLTAAEKKRMEEELRIARQIQMSLLPRGPLDFPGISMTALCVPAREVGGDYYDFFHVGDRQLGVLIADVSGKGTSAALYMAELKGLMLSLSQIYTSPRQLLMEVNRIISENLDTRSFITMTYGVLDLAKGRDDLRAGGAHAAGVFPRRRDRRARPRPRAERHRRRPAHSRRDREVRRAARGGADRAAQGRRARALHRRHHRGDGRRAATCSATRGSAA